MGSLTHPPGELFALWPLLPLHPKRYSTDHAHACDYVAIWWFYGLIVKAGASPRIPRQSLCERAVRPCKHAAAARRTTFGCLRRTTRLSLRGIEPFRDFVSVLQSGVTEIPAEVAYAGTGTVRYTW